MNRKQKVEDLIRNELEWLVSNYDKHSLEEVTEFFLSGGFSNWTDEQIEKKWQDFCLED